jgi:putative nucleotidyltransferase with HDIG domain
MNLSLDQELVNDLTAEGKLYEVGGSVRDSLLPRQSEIETSIKATLSKDRDFLVTGIALEQLMRLLRKFGKVDLVGKSFGVIKFTPIGGPTFDFAIPRTERSTGIAHRDFDVTYDPGLPVEVDLRRRDFTINAMARDIPTGEIVDPFGGRADLNNRIVRIVFPEAIEEDPLRILRGAQFAARFEFEIETETLAAMKAGTHLIDTVSPERIADELNKMLTRAVKPSIGFRYLLMVGALKRILPELVEGVGVEQPGGFHRWDVFDHTLVCVDSAPSSLHIRLAALFHDIGKPATRELVDGGATFYGHDRLSTDLAIKAMKRLRYSNEMIDKVAVLVSKHMFSDRAGEKGIRRLIRIVGQDLIFDLIALRRADIMAQGMGQDPTEADDFASRIKAEIDKKPPFGVKDLAVNGDDIMRDLNLQPGPIIGRILNDLLEMVLDDPEANNYAALISRAGHLLASENNSA